MARRKDPMIVLESELYDRLSMVSGYPKEVVRDVILSLGEFVIDEIKSGIPVVLGRIGSISVIDVKTYGGYNFHTKKKGDPHVYKKLKFSPSKNLKEAVKDSQ